MTLTAQTAVGVNVTASSGLTTLGAAVLDSNPVSAVLPATVTPLLYFDVFGFGTGAASAAVDFYDTTATPITQNSLVYFYNTTASNWQVCSNLTVSTANDFIEVAIASAAGSNPATAPTPAQFEGLQFALVNGPQVRQLLLLPLPRLTPLRQLMPHRLQLHRRLLPRQQRQQQRLPPRLKLRPAANPSFLPVSSTDLWLSA